IDASIAIVTDEYMFNFYKDVFREVHYVSPDNYIEVFDRESIDAFIYITCWKGVNGEEWKGLTFRDKPREALESILSIARDRAIPTVFQTIEDPSNFEYFLPVARQFDYIFTSDRDCIDQYRDAVDHDRVYYGEYGANPLINN